MLVRLVALLGLCFLAACADDKGAPLHLVLGHKAADTHRCAGPTDPPITSRATTLRVSVRTHGVNDDQGMFDCDRIIDVSKGEHPAIQAPLKNAASLDIYAEGFFFNTTTNQLERVASGALLGVDPKLPNTGAPLVLYE